MPIGAPEGFGEIEILAKSVFNSWILSSKQGRPTLYHFEVDGGGFMYLPSGKLEALKSCSNLSKASLMCRLRGSIDEGPLGLSSCWPFLSSRPRTEVEDLGIVSLGSERSRMCLKVSTFAHWEGKSVHSFKHGSLEHPHLLLQLDVKLCTQGFLKLRFVFFCCKTVHGVGGTVFAGVFKDNASERKG